MEHVIMYKSGGLDLKDCTNNDIKMIVDHYRFLSESLTRRIDQRLNKILPKMFYKVESMMDKTEISIKAGVKIGALDNCVSDIIKEFLTPVCHIRNNNGDVKFKQELHISIEEWKK